MYNPSAADIQEILMLKRAHPAIERHMNELLDHLAVATRKVEFYEGIASRDTIAKAEAAGFVGMNAMEKAAFLTKAAGGQQRVPMGDQLAAIASPAEREALAKRVPTAAGAPVGTRMVAGAVVDNATLAVIRGASSGFLPAGHCGLNR